MSLKILSNMKKNKKTIILGLNGWFERGHDASACLVVDSKIVAFAEEERFTRKRYSYDSLPVMSATYCLDEAKIGVDDIDCVVYGWDLPKTYRLRGGNFPYSKKQILVKVFPADLYKYKNLPKLDFVDHHLAHAASTYHTSGFKESSILILDGQGEDASGALAYGKDGKIKILEKIPISFSLGYMMEGACKYLGLRTSDAGKLMGLAGHGKNGKIFDNVNFNGSGYSIENFPKDNAIMKDSLDEQEKVIQLWKNYFSSKYPLRVKKEHVFDQLKGAVSGKLIFDQSHKDFALSVQRTLEEVVIHLTKILFSKTGCRNLVIAGGIGLNCTTNGRLISEGIVDDLYVLPAANDAGVAIGAALAKAHRIQDYKSKRLDNIYLGPQYNNPQIKRVLDELKIPYTKSKVVYKLAAKSLSEGKIVGWFQGRMEGGPRALGNRSILANPGIKRMHTTVNKIKSRENWRPLAPSILDEFRSEYFKKGVYSPFMLQNHKVVKEKAGRIQAVVHTDLSSRYQSVNRKLNEKFYLLIKEFYKLTDLPLVLNTSFNVGGEPIVCTPEQAIRTFYSSAIDCLAIGDYWITKK